MGIDLTVQHGTACSGRSGCSLVGPVLNHTKNSQWPGWGHILGMALPFASAVTDGLAAFGLLGLGEESFWGRHALCSCTLRLVSPTCASASATDYRAQCQNYKAPHWTAVWTGISSLHGLARSYPVCCYCSCYCCYIAASSPIRQLHAYRVYRTTGRPERQLGFSGPI